MHGIRIESVKSNPSIIILGKFKLKITFKLKSDHSNVFAMLSLVVIDTSFAFVVYLAPEIMHFLFFKMA